MSRQFLDNRVVVRGAGEMASGVIRRLFMAGFEVVALERAAPSCIRRTVCFAEAFFERNVTVEGVTAVLMDSADEAAAATVQRRVPLLVDPEAELLPVLKPLVLVDGRMLKKAIDCTLDMAPIVIGLGPGFVAGQNCHAVVETDRGFDLGRVIYNGSPHAHTGVPAPVDGVSLDRLLRSPADGVFAARCRISDTVKAGQVVGRVAGVSVVSRIEGIVRGLVRDGLKVSTGQKIGDVDPRGIKEYCYKMSDKANAIGGGALEALMVLKAGIKQQHEQ